ncbi:MAG: PAS domain-containing protein, partial [Nitrospinae bacterium]|nr:PAS domain-containing protein [Nitrospinota bacterium]
MSQEPSSPTTGRAGMERLREQARQILERAPMKLPDADVDDLRAILEELQVSQIELELQNEELRRTQRSLEEARDRFSDLYHHTPVGYLSLDRSGLVHDVNNTFLQMLGVLPKELLRKPLSAFVEKESRNDFFSGFLPFYRSPESHPLEVWLAAPQGRRFLARLEGRRVDPDAETGGDGDAGHLRVAVIDHTPRHQSEERQRLSSAALHATSEGVVLTDADQKIIEVNAAFTRSTGYTIDEVVGRRPRLLKSGRHDTAFYQEMWRCLGEFGTWRGEIWNRRKNGEIYPEWLNISAIRNGAGVVTAYAGIFSDLSAQESVRQRLHHLAYYDALTGLPNRQLCLDRLRNALAQARREGGKVGIAFIDIDR